MNDPEYRETKLTHENNEIALSEMPGLSDLMTQLEVMLGQPPRAPVMGLDAAVKIASCFEIVAADVEAIAADRVKAVLGLEQEAKSYASVLRNAGAYLSDRIKAEAARAYKLSLILRETRTLLNVEAPTPEEPATPQIAANPQSPLQQRNNPNDRGTGLVRP